MDFFRSVERNWIDDIQMRVIITSFKKCEQWTKNPSNQFFLQFNCERIDSDLEYDDMKLKKCAFNWWMKYIYIWLKLLSFTQSHSFEEQLWFLNLSPIIRKP